MAQFYRCDRCGKEYSLNDIPYDDKYNEYNIVRRKYDIDFIVDLCIDCKHELFGFLNLDNAEG